MAKRKDDFSDFDALYNDTSLGGHQSPYGSPYGAPDGGSTGAYGPSGPMMGPSGPSMGPSGPMMGPSGPSMGPSGPMMGPSGPMMRAENAPKASRHRHGHDNNDDMDDLLK